MIFDIDIHAHLYGTRHIMLPNYSLEVYRYSHPFVKSNNPINPNQENDFTTNELRMAYATARTLCSYHLDNKELYFDIIASLLSHFNFITKNANQYLQLKESRLERLRDFSKTTRIGELAQGINYLFVQERLNFPFIIDFHLLYEIVYGTPYSGTKTPDFVVLNTDFSAYGLFESKGEASKKNTITGNSGKLQKALNQLESIHQPCVNFLIPCATRFENDATTRNSSIHYSLLNKVCNPKDDFVLRIFRQHFASWFYLVGDFERANMLLSNENITEFTDADNYILGDDDQGKDNVYWLKRPISIDFNLNNQRSFIHVYTHFFHRHGFNIGIYKDVVKQLITGELNEQFSYSIDSQGNYKRFADGTVIKFNMSNK